MTVPAFTPDEITLSESTRSARLKWVILVDESMPRGLLANAVACIAASVGNAIDGLIGPDVPDAAGVLHAGLPWIGCTVLAASPAQLEELRLKAANNESIFIADMPPVAQATRIYDEYSAAIGSTTQPGTLALGIIGPRNAVDRMVKRLPLLS